MFSAPELIFGGTDSVCSRFHVLRSRTHFRWCRRRRVSFSRFLRSRTRFRRFRGSQIPFSCFVLPDTFSVVARASGPVFKFCALGHVSAVRRVSGPVFMFCVSVLVFGGTEGVGSWYHVSRSQTHFRRFRGRQVPFSCFASPYSFSALARASGPVFIFCVPGHVFDGIDSVGSRFHALRSRTCFRRFRGR
jgi:hypothetical protein